MRDSRRTKCLDLPGDYVWEGGVRLGAEQGEHS